MITFEKFAKVWHFLKDGREIYVAQAERAIKKDKMDKKREQKMGIL